MWLTIICRNFHFSSNILKDKNIYIYKKKKKKLNVLNVINWTALAGIKVPHWFVAINFFQILASSLSDITVKFNILTCHL